MHWDHTEGEKKKKNQASKSWETAAWLREWERGGSTDPPQWKHAKKEKSDFFKALWQLSPTISTETAPRAPAPLSSSKPTLLASTIQTGTHERANTLVQQHDPARSRSAESWGQGLRRDSNSEKHAHRHSFLTAGEEGSSRAANHPLFASWLLENIFFFKLTDYSTFLADSFVAWRSHLICKYFSVARKWREYPNLSLSPCMMSLLTNGSSTQKFRTVLGGFCWFFSHC